MQLRRTVSFLLLAATLLAVPACDSNDEKTDIQGLWMAQGIDVIYFHIQKNTITIYDYLFDEYDEYFADCYIITELKIVRRDGTEVTVSSPDFPGIQVVMTLERDGETLVYAVAGGGEEILEKSNLSVATFRANECVGLDPSKAPSDGLRPPSKLPFRQ